MSECYVAKKGYQLECDKLLHRGMGEGGQNGKFFRYVFFE